MLKVWNTWTYVYIGNTIVYDVKSYQVKTTKLKYTEVRKTVVGFNYSNKEILVSPTSMWRNITNLNMKLSHKQYQFE